MGHFSAKTRHSPGQLSAEINTCDPNELVAPIHPKAMITILEPEEHETWLRGSYESIVALQRPFPADRMTVRGPVFPTRGKAA